MGPKKKIEKKNSKNKGLSKVSAKQKTVALTGGGYKGKALLRWLESDSRFPKVIYLNERTPDIKLKKTKFYRVDLTETLADEKLAEILKKEKVDTLIHTAIPVTPPHNLARAHELISVGSMYVCNAASAANVRKMILSSTADVYGAYPNNPSYLTEKTPTRGGENSRFLADKIDAEKYFMRFGAGDPKRVVTILRYATILGPNIKSYKTRYLERWYVPTVLGFDPMIQFVHEEDLLEAFKLAVLQDHKGIFNIASKGVIPLSKAIRLLGKVPIPMTLSLLKPLVQLLWYANISPAPSNRLDYLKYPCCIATDKAEKELKFIPTKNCKEALIEFAGAERLRDVHLQEGAFV